MSHDATAVTEDGEQIHLWASAAEPGARLGVIVAVGEEPRFMHLCEADAFRFANGILALLAQAAQRADDERIDRLVRDLAPTSSATTPAPRGS